MMSQDYKFVCVWIAFRGIERNRPTTGFSRATGLPVSNVWKVRRKMRGANGQRKPSCVLSVHYLVYTDRWCVSSELYAMSSVFSSLHLVDDLAQVNIIN